MELEQLIARVKKKDRNAQSELFGRYKGILYLICLKYCRNRVDAEDHLHDAFITILERIKSYKGKGSFEGWMKRIVIYSAIDKYKKAKLSTLPVIDDILEDTTTQIETSQYTLDQILDAIQTLPDQYRLVFSLYELDDYSHNEIAQLLNIAQGTSKSNLHRAKLLLKDRLLNDRKTTELRHNVS